MTFIKKLNVSFLLFLLFSCSAVNCQNPSQPRPPRKPVHGIHDHDTKELKDAPNLPHLPTYTGKSAKLELCHYYPNLKDNQCYVMRYLVKETPNLAMDWYKQSLLQNGWHVTKENSTQTHVSARIKAKGLYLIVSATKSANPAYRCTLEVRYMDFHPPSITPES